MPIIDQGQEPSTSSSRSTPADECNGVQGEIFPPAQLTWHVMCSYLPREIVLRCKTAYYKNLLDAKIYLNWCIRYTPS